MKHKKHDVLNAAYLFYYASDAIFQPGGSSDDAAAHEAKSKSRLGERLNARVGDMMVVAKNVSDSQVSSHRILRPLSSSFPHRGTGPRSLNHERTRNSRQGTRGWEQGTW
jgi:hypothetical protein